MVLSKAALRLTGNPTKPTDRGRGARPCAFENASGAKPCGQFARGHGSKNQTWVHARNGETDAA
jgi:hypothetical protein